MDTLGVINSLFGVPRALVGASADFHGVMIENTHVGRISRARLARRAFWRLT
jgi:hypothetical protein